MSDKSVVQVFHKFHETRRSALRCTLQIVAASLLQLPPQVMSVSGGVGEGGIATPRPIDKVDSYTVKKNAKCAGVVPTEEVDLGIQENEQRCALACFNHEMPACKYFLYNSQTKSCVLEPTESDMCLPGGFTDSDYDLFKLTGEYLVPCSLRPHSFHPPTFSVFHHT
jgi:hypothetical protein